MKRWTCRVLAAAAALFSFFGANPVLGQTAAPQDLALQVYPAARDSQTLAVLYSGDGGWWFVEDGVAKGLAAQGVAVAGINSLRYFWKRRTPQSAAEDLAALLEQYGKAWGRQRYVLAGYSFGADVLPFIVQKLPPEVRARVAAVVLIAPWHNADFEFHFSGWVGDPKRADSLSVLEGIRSLKGPVLCLYGRDDANASCAETDPASVTRIPLEGGHTFAGDSGALAQAILQALPFKP